MRRLTIFHRCVTNLLVLTSFFIGMNNPVFGQSSQGTDQIKLQQFEDAITRGEEFLKLKEYAKAKAEYQKALSIDPAAQYPKDKLAYIRKFYVDPADEARFAQAMEKGNAMMNAEDYPGALLQFENALSIKPEDSNLRDLKAQAEKLNAARQEALKQYDKLIADADKRFTAADLAGARDAYAAASELDPRAQYPKNRIAEIDNRTAAEKAKKDAYEKSLSEGDEAYMSRDFTTAKLKYEQALKLKPGENYPKSMLERVAQGSAQLKDAQVNYQNAIASADKLLASNDYETALQAYKTAAGILPGEKYPGEQIGKINAILQKKQQLNDDYTQIVTTADQYFKDAMYAEAKTEFQRANNLKPEETYPKQKIEEIAAILLAQKEAERNKKYNDKIREADDLLTSLNYPDALTAYKEALLIKDDETYPKEKITAINKRIADEQALRVSYNNAIALADQKFKAGAWQEAIDLYRSAQQYAPTEPYPASQVLRAQKSLEDMKLKSEKYDQFVATADNLFAFGELEKAGINYQQALGIKPGSSYPASQLEKISQLLAAARSNDEQYQKLLTAADAFLRKEEYQDALDTYQQASLIKPDETYPVEQSAKLRALLADARAQKEAYTAAVAAADKLFDQAAYVMAADKYREAQKLMPKEEYPQQRIEAINVLLEEQKSLEENYARNIREGDDAYGQNRLEPALTAYKKAQLLKPTEQYPKDRIEEIGKKLNEQQSLNEKYRNSIAEADRLFQNQSLDASANKYKEARDLKPDESYPQEQIGIINNLIAKQKEKNAAYQRLIEEADLLMESQQPEPALGKYREAMALKPDESYPAQQITRISDQLSALEKTEQSYAEAISRADQDFASGLFDAASTGYRQALSFKPDERYPQDQLAAIEQKKSELKSLEENYRQAVAAADKQYDEKDYTGALQTYQKALTFRANETYPNERISTIQSILDEQKQLADKDYNNAIETADRQFNLQDYMSARKSYETASALKPEQSYPKNKLIEINKILMERVQNQLNAYNSLIVKADQAYQDKIYDQAIDGYEAAAAAKPDETYPGEMIRKIRTYMEDHAMIDLVNSPTLINSGSEQKFRFQPIEMRLRKNNYIILKARKTGEAEPKIYLNYGIGNQKSGGIVLRSIKSDETGDYMVRVSVQDRWYRLDNNWVSVYSEGGDVEISRMQIAQGD